MLISKHSIIKKSRLIGFFVAMLMMFSAVAVVVLLAEQRSITLTHATNELENDIGFLSDLIKESYLEKDYSGIEQTLTNWTNKYALEHEVVVKAENGFVIFEYHKSPEVNDNHVGEHLFTIKRDIHDADRLLMRVKLVRDLSDIMQKYYILRNQVIIFSTLLVVLLATILWRMLRVMVFVPLESEISKRHQAENKLLESHELLEARVERRTEELVKSNQELQEVLQKYRQSEAQMIKLSSAIEQTDDIVTIANKNGIIEYVNPSLERVTGYSAEEVIGKTPAMFQSGKHDRNFYEKLWKTIWKGEVFNDVFINRRKDGSIYYEEKTITPIRDEQGEITYYVATGKDITDRIKAQERLEFMATHDALTELPNRTLLRDRLQHAINKTEREGTKVAVMFLDLDKFKHVNDSLGHVVGDQLLRIVAMRINNTIRKGDTIARLGGDEFTIVVEDVEDVDYVSRLAQKIIDALSESIFVESYELIPTTSIGITIYPNDGDNVDDLLKNADIAMYRAKALGGGCYQYFTEDMTVHAVEQLELRNKLTHALSNNELELYYQPRINIATEKVCGMEALLRWNNKSMGQILPDKFIPILEESHHIVDVGIWVLNQAFQFNQLLIRNGVNPISVSVNLSARQFRDKKTLDAIAEIHKQYGSLDGLLEVEITETLLVESIDLAAEIMTKLHDMGVTISIDDFGTGYSSMAYLKRFPIDALKIDRSFVMDTPADKDDVAIVQAVIALANSLGMRSVAEGVETQDQYRLLRMLGCDEIQGYLISRPIAADEFTQWLSNRRVEYLKKA